MALRRYRYGMRHHWVSSQKIGVLTPCFHQEVTPGDTWYGQTNGLIRMAPINAPVFASIRCEMFFFFIPHRIIWDEFEDWITDQDSGIQFPLFFAPSDQPTLGLEYIHRALGFGKLDEAFNDQDVSALPLRAYNRVYNEFFRDQQVEPEIGESNTVLLRGNFKAADFYSRARPEIQQGDETQISVTPDPGDDYVTVQAIRDGFHRQKVKERRAQYGERYTDYLRAMGLRVPDSLLDRPEFVGHGSATMGISEVVSTADTGTAGLGDYRGHGITGIRVKFRKRSFLEHGTLMGLMLMRPRNMFSNRVDHSWKRTQWQRYYQPELSPDEWDTLQVEEVNSQMTNKPDSRSIIGYIPRFEDLRTARDTVASTHMQQVGQHIWHAGRYFQTDDQPTINEVINVPFYPDWWQDSNSPDFYTYFDHAIGKRSVIQPRKR